MRYGAELSGQIMTKEVPVMVDYQNLVKKICTVVCSIVVLDRD